MPAPSPAVVDAALRGDRRALDAFVRELAPVVHARVARCLARSRARGGRAALRQEVEDMTQDVFATLFAHEGHVLRAWDPERGLSLPNYVGLIAERHVASVLRSGRRNPWRERLAELDVIEPATEPVTDAEPQIESRQVLEALLDRMRAALSPRGLELFHRLYVREEPIEEVAVTMRMTREAIYAWRSRVTKLLRAFAEENDADSVAPAPLRRGEV